MSDLSRKGIGELAGSLTAGQLVAVVTVAAGLVTSSFGVGLWLGQTVENTAHENTKLALARAEDRVARAEAAAADLEEDRDRLTADQAFLQTKNQFLGLLVLWHDARNEVSEGDPSPEVERRYDELSRNLVGFVRDVVERSRSGEAGAEVRARLGKGIEPTITFERDQSTFPLPPMFFAAER